MYNSTENCRKMKRGAKKRIRDLHTEYEANLSKCQQEHMKRSQQEWNTISSTANEACKHCFVCKEAYQRLKTLRDAEQDLFSSSNVYNDSLRQNIVLFLCGGKNSEILKVLPRECLNEFALFWWHSQRKDPPSFLFL